MSPSIASSKEVTEVQTPASGYETDGSGLTVPVNPSSAGDDYICSTGYHSDGNGNCIADGIKTVCADGYIQKSDGECILPPAVCDVGYESDGNGNCIPLSVTSACASGYESDGNGDCLLIAPKVEAPPPVSVEQA